MKNLILFLFLSFGTLGVSQNELSNSNQEMYDKILDEFVVDIVGKQGISGDEDLRVNDFLENVASQIFRYESKTFLNSRAAIDEVCRHLLLEDKEKGIDKGAIGKIIIKGGLSAALSFIPVFGGAINSAITTPWEVYDEVQKTKVENAKIRSTNDVLELWDNVKNDLISMDRDVTSDRVLLALREEYLAIKQQAEIDQINGPLELYLLDLNDFKNSLNKVPEQEEIKFRMLQNILAELGRSSRAGLVVKLDLTNCGTVENLDFQKQICLPLDDEIEYEIKGPKSFYFKEQFDKYFANSKKSYDDLNVYKYYELTFLSEQKMGSPIINKIIGEANVMDGNYSVMIGYQTPTDIIQISPIKVVEKTFPWLSIIWEGDNNNNNKYSDIFGIILDNYMTKLEFKKQDDLPDDYWDEEEEVDNSKEFEMSYPDENEDVEQSAGVNPLIPQESIATLLPCEVKLKKVKNGYAFYGGDKVKDVLKRLKQSGQLQISDFDIEVMHRVSNVESGGKISCVNSWDGARMSFGFIQLTAQHDKIQKLIKQNPEVFAKHGLSLTGKKYVNGLKKWKGIDVITGADHPNDLRSIEFANKFACAGLDDEVIVCEARHIKTILAYQKGRMAARCRNKSNKDYFNKYFNKFYSDYKVASLLQASFNNYPMCLFSALRGALRIGKNRDVTETDAFFEILKSQVKLAFKKQSYSLQDEKDWTEKKRARFELRGVNHVKKTAKG